MTVITASHNGDVMSVTPPGDDPGHAKGTLKTQECVSGTCQHTCEPGQVPACATMGRPLLGQPPAARAVIQDALRPARRRAGPPARPAARHRGAVTARRVCRYRSARTRAELVLAHFGLPYPAAQPPLARLDQRPRTGHSLALGARTLSACGLAWCRGDLPTRIGTVGNASSLTAASSEVAVPICVMHRHCWEMRWSSRRRAWPGSLPLPAG